MMTHDPSSDQWLVSGRFPRSARYNPAWVRAGVSGGANVLWLTEWLTEAVALRPGLRVLDLGCGRAMSSIFLHREFGVQVWATDLWFSASENLQRIRDAGVGDGVFPLHADARSLPFANGFFDVILGVDSFVYYGTDDLYLNYLARLVKPGGVIGIVGAGLTREIGAQVPDHLQAWWTPGHWCLHAAPWWQRHWQRTGLVDVELADALPDGWRYWQDWLKAVAPDNDSELAALAADQGNYLGYVRVVARRRENIQPEEPIVSVPAHYTPAPLLRPTA
jgi:cyclopropane fatty-acyl-phospholipid synthase-like methyltransferase